jgi:disulfide oxidoreductase YuzD
MAREKKTFEEMAAAFKAKFPNAKFVVPKVKSRAKAVTDEPTEKKAKKKKNE